MARISYWFQREFQFKRHRRHRRQGQIAYYPYIFILFF